MEPRRDRPVALARDTALLVATLLLTLALLVYVIAVLARAM